MASLGRVAEIWSYPVSSVGGERVDAVYVTPPVGVVGDRRFALIDVERGAVATPERQLHWRPALQLRSTQPTGEAPSIHFPDGGITSIEDAAINKRLSEYFGFRVAIAGYEVQGAFPAARHRHKHFPAHLLTTSSLAHLATLRNGAPLDSRRFRPTFLIETHNRDGFVEDGWIGKRLRLGEVDMFAEEQTKRCGVTFLAQPGLAEDPDILRSILRTNKRHLGVYCSIRSSGTVRLGDELTMEA